MVDGSRASCRDPDLVGAAREVAVMVTVAGSQLPTFGAVYRPLASIAPPLAGATAEVTAVLLVFETGAVNWAV
jgi:hypothetical protein